MSDDMMAMIWELTSRAMQQKPLSKLPAPIVINAICKQTAVN